MVFFRWGCSTNIFPKVFYKLIKLNNQEILYNCSLVFLKNLFLDSLWDRQYSISGFGLESLSKNTLLAQAAGYGWQYSILSTQNASFVRYLLDEHLHLFSNK